MLHSIQGTSHLGVKTVNTTTCFPVTGKLLCVLALTVIKQLTK